MEIVMEGREFDIGIAKEDDFDHLSSLVKDWAKGMGFDIIDDEITADLRRTEKNGVVIVARQDGEIVGMMTGIKAYHFWIKADIGHEHWFFVRPDKRRTGLGDLLVEAFCAWATVNKCESVIITPNRFGSVNPEKIASALARKKDFEYHGFEMRRRI